MAFGKHTRTESGTFRRERAILSPRMWRQDYRNFSTVHDSTKLGTPKRFGASSLSDVRAALLKIKE